MKSFKEHLLESKQTYNFKIKLVGDHADEISDKMESALTRFKVETFSAAKHTPIQETQLDFPSHQNIGVTMCDVSLCYPATTAQLQNLLAEALNLLPACIKIHTLHEHEEELINHQYDEKSGNTVLGKNYPKSDNQSIVGDKHTMLLLKELSKTKHQGESYKGVNAALLVKKSPSEKVAPSKINKKDGSISTVGSRDVPKPTADMGRK